MCAGIAELPRIEIFNPALEIGQINAEMVAAFRLGELRFLLDIDGTLSDFHDDKMKAFVHPDIVQLIYMMEILRPGTVTFVTGRPEAEVLRLFPLPDGRDLFGALRRRPNMICNHGKVAIIEGEVLEFNMTEGQKAFLEIARAGAQAKVENFILISQLADFADIIRGHDGIKIGFVGADGGRKEGYLFEVKYDHKGLASFAFHWRALEALQSQHAGEGEARLKTIVENYRTSVVATAQAEYNTHLNNPPIQIPERAEGAVAPYFRGSVNSDKVCEFCPADEHLNKGTMVHLAWDRIRAGKKSTYPIALGDSVPGTDVGLLQAALALDPERGGRRLAFSVRHAGSTKPIGAAAEAGLTGTFHSVPGANPEVGATLKFLNESGLKEVCVRDFKALLFNSLVTETAKHTSALPRSTGGKFVGKLPSPWPEFVEALEGLRDQRLLERDAEIVMRPAIESLSPRSALRKAFGQYFEYIGGASQYVPPGMALL